jgi:hypothetical protein
MILSVEPHPGARKGCCLDLTSPFSRKQLLSISRYYSSIHLVDIVKTMKALGYEVLNMSLEQEGVNTEPLFVRRSRVLHHNNMYT